MPEDDKAKAEKIAAAKKRYEQLKKQKAKKAPSKDPHEGKSRKRDKDTEDEPAQVPPEGDDELNEEGESYETTEVTNTESKVGPHNQHKSHERQSSLSQQSRIRSTSFRASLPEDAAVSPRSSTSKSGPISPAHDVADVYRRQQARIEELEKENKALTADVDRRQDLERKIEELQEAASSNITSDVTSSHLSKLQDELLALKRQNTQLSQQLNSKKPRQGSSDNSDSTLKSDLASKNSLIQTMELEISSANARIANLEAQQNEQTVLISTLQDKVSLSQDANAALAEELEQLRSQDVSQGDISTASPPHDKLVVLERSLAGARQGTLDAEARAERLDQKITTLNTLHREAETRHASTIEEAHKFEREAKELRLRMTSLQTENSRLRDESSRRARMEASGDAHGLEEIEDEERSRLSERVRALEEENFELRRGVWRDARKSMQPGPDTEENSLGAFDDIDLSASLRDRGPASPRLLQRNHSTFADVINSGISAFTAAPTRARQQSITDGFADDDDFNFDEDAFRKAHEAEAKARLERVKDIKRGLPKWQGWRVDLADMRAGSGTVFDV